ncbi:hypothetical protein LJC61_09015, partial [Ruminococcaceae bacterium OttesenSCG-928-A16]|nr:hypothetical protein [Ruminococcaceae bacterium OttesenSCG-928-A16]
LASLAEKENALQCKEYLIDNNYPLEMLEFITASDIEEFKQKADKASKLVGNATWVAPLRDLEAPPNAGLASAFGKTKHKPKKYPFNYDDD